MSFRRVGFVLACIISLARGSLRAQDVSKTNGVFLPGNLTLTAGQSIQSRQFTLVMQADCNLVLYRRDSHGFERAGSFSVGVAEWSSNTSAAILGKTCTDPTLSYATDGTLAIGATVNGTAGTTIWSIPSQGSSGFALLSKEPFFEVLNPDGSLFWSPLNTIDSLYPAFDKTIGFFNPPYSQLVSSISPATPAEGDFAESFLAPDGQRVSVVVKSPVVANQQAIAPIQPGQDPSEYFFDAVANAAPSTTLVFPANQVYDFGPTDCSAAANFGPHSGAHWSINNATDLVIDGNGSRLNFSSPCYGIFLNGATRVVLKNFTIDWPNLQMASIGTITAVNPDPLGPGGWLYDVQLDAQYVAGARSLIEDVTAWDRENNYWSLVKPNDDVTYGSAGAQAVVSANGTYTTQTAQIVNGISRNVRSYGAQFTVGEAVLIRHYSNEGSVIGATGQDIAFENIVIYSGPDVAYWFPRGRGFHVDRCRLTRSAGRPISASGGMQIGDQVAGDVVIENSVFAYQGDDGENLHAGLIPVPAAAADTLQIGTAPNWLAQPKDTLLFFDPQLLFNGSATVEAAASNSDGTTSTLTLSQMVPGPDGGGGMVDAAEAGARYIIRNNSFLYNRARGVLLQSPYGLVQGNTFIGQTLFSVYLVTSTFSQEGPGAQDVLVLGNNISRCGNGGGLGAVVAVEEDLQANPIYVSRPQPAATPAMPPIHQNVIFAENFVHQVPGAGFYIAASNNILLYRNTLSNTNFESLPNTFNQAPDTGFPIVINDASNVWIYKNPITGIAAAANRVSVDENTTAGIVVQQ